MSKLTPEEESVLAFVVQARHLPDMPVEFWQALAIMRSKGLIEFRGGHWRPSADQALANVLPAPTHVEDYAVAAGR